MKKDYRAQTVSSVEKVVNTTGVHVRGVVHATERIQRNISIHPNGGVGVRRLVNRIPGIRFLGRIR